MRLTAQIDIGAPPSFQPIQTGQSREQATEFVDQAGQHLVQIETRWGVAGDVVDQGHGVWRGTPERELSGTLGPEAAASIHLLVASVGEPAAS